MSGRPKRKPPGQRRRLAGSTHEELAEAHRRIQEARGSINSNIIKCEEDDADHKVLIKLDEEEADPRPTTAPPPKPESREALSKALQSADSEVENLERLLADAHARYDAILADASVPSVLVPKEVEVNSRRDKTRLGGFGSKIRKARERQRASPLSASEEDPMEAPGPASMVTERNTQHRDFSGNVDQISTDSDIDLETPLFPDSLVPEPVDDADADADGLDVVIVGESFITGRSRLSRIRIGPGVLEDDDDEDFNIDDIESFKCDDIESPSQEDCNNEADGEGTEPASRRRTRHHGQTKKTAKDKPKKPNKTEKPKKKPKPKNWLDEYTVPRGESDDETLYAFQRPPPSPKAPEEPQARGIKREHTDSDEEIFSAPVRRRISASARELGARESSVELIAPPVPWKAPTDWNDAIAASDNPERKAYAHELIQAWPPYSFPNHEPPLLPLQFPRDFISSHALGGNRQKTWCRVSRAMQRKFNHRIRYYYCKMPSWDPHLPHKPGAHGVVYDTATETKVGHKRDADGLCPVFCQRRSGVWEYCGEYRITVRPLIEGEWAQVPWTTKKLWGDMWSIERGGPEALMREGLLEEGGSITCEEVLKLIDDGLIVVVAKIFECMGYNWGLHNYLLKMWDKYVELKGIAEIKKEQLEEEDF